MVTPNPVAMAANTVRQLGETANQTVMTLGNQFAQANSQILRGIASGQPPVPIPGVAGGIPLPGLNGQAAGNGNPNGNGAVPGLPTPQQLVPVQALRAINSFENAIIPAGLPRPSAALLAAANGRPVEEGPEEQPPLARRDPTRAGAETGIEGLNGLDRRGARTGIQLV